MTLVCSPFEENYFGIHFINLVYFFAAENGGSLVTAVSKLTNADKQPEEVYPICNHKNDNGNSNTTEEKANTEESDLPERYKT